jgi:hypothetical protein
MISGFGAWFTGLLARPTATFASLKDAPLRFVVLYFLAVWAVFAALLGLVGSWLESFPDTFIMIMVMVMVLAGWLFACLTTHAALRIVIGPRSFDKTVRAVLLSATPLAAIGWIPFITGISFVWAIFLADRGMTVYHGTSRLTTPVVLFIALALDAVTLLMAYYYLPLLTTII